MRFCAFVVFFLLGGVRRGSSLLWASWASRVLGCCFLLPLALFCGVGAFLLFFASCGCSFLVAFSGGSALVAFFFCPPAFRSCAFRGSSLRLALACAFSLRCVCVLARSLCFCLSSSFCCCASVAWFFLFLRCSLVIRRVAAFFFVLFGIKRRPPLDRYTKLTSVVKLGWFWSVRSSRVARGMLYVPLRFFFLICNIAYGETG